MKKNLFYLAMMLCGAAMMTACGSDDNGGFGNNTAGGPAAVQAVNPSKVFDGKMPQSINGQRIHTDAAGRVTAIGSSVTFTYITSDDESRSTKSYDVIMNNGNQTLYLCLNENGFIKHAESDIEEYGFQYTGNRISAMYFRDKEDNYTEKTTFSYQDNNLVSVSGSGAGIGNGTLRTSYTNEQYPNGIENKNRWFFPSYNIGGFDFEELLGAYYAGMLGYGSEKLPLMLKEDVRSYEGNYTSTEKYSWTLNSSGYPTYVVANWTASMGDESESGSFSVSFSW